MRGASYLWDYFAEFLDDVLVRDKDLIRKSFPSYELTPFSTNTYQSECYNCSISPLVAS